MTRQRQPRQVTPERPVEEWDWAEIRAREAVARAKARRLKRCTGCGRPLWCSQPDRHQVCSP